MSSLPPVPGRADDSGALPLPEVPAERDLPPGHHLAHRELLLEAIRADRRATARRRGRRHLPRPFLLPVAASVALAVAVGLAVPGADEPDLVPATVVPVAEGDPSGAPALLDDIALAAAGDEVRVEPDQFVYVESLVSSLQVVVDTDTSPYTTQIHSDRPRLRQVWTSPDGRRGLLVEEGEEPAEGLPLEGTGDADLQDPSHDFLTTLPTDPEALLEMVYADGRGAGGNADQRAFSTIGGLLAETLPPPDLGAALYRAAARIPGVVVVEEAEDLTGRAGVAVARTDEASGERVEWIFDPASFAYLGERTVQTRETREGVPAGTVTSSVAVLSRTVVEDLRALPDERAPR
ncbi:CU044_5270 family protein [Marinactinospora thermotolerans]|uniref:CU044_5270 family protein n=1 Tax=Marinactinospora thermotolerans DSM 45154 TaxID=1122192 RepID=A0A1T4Q6C0_9ACTN|nr:CU044_5270 family protein [Marinactinospora thermotolerans]SJZ99071.1 hypothetical protein SAMN02745673_02056 [Marinactinospora thermotolerans DSM 45154]